MFYCVDSAGNTRLTVFLMKCKKRNHGFTDQHLKQFGSAEDSTVIMMALVFMYTVIWETIVLNLVIGYHSTNKHEKEIHK